MHFQRRLTHTLKAQKPSFEVRRFVLCSHVFEQLETLYKDYWIEQSGFLHTLFKLTLSTLSEPMPGTGQVGYLAEVIQQQKPVSPSFRGRTAAYCRSISLGTSVWSLSARLPLAADHANLLDLQSRQQHLLPSGSFGVPPGWVEKRKYSNIPSHRKFIYHFPPKDEGQKHSKHNQL